MYGTSGSTYTTGPIKSHTKYITIESLTKDQKVYIYTKSTGFTYIELKIIYLGIIQ